MSIFGRHRIKDPVEGHAEIVQANRRNEGHTSGNCHMQLLLDDVPGIKPARYLARFHWVTIVDVSAVPADYLMELVEWSYTAAVTRPGSRRTHAHSTR